MSAIEITITNYCFEPEKTFRKLLDGFAESHAVDVQCILHEWGVTWSELMKILLYKQGPVISQVGSTWMGSLESTDGLRSLLGYEVQTIGGGAAFHPAAWASVQDASKNRVLGIPWFLDSYILYYRRDLLEKAGIDESTAFQSLETLDETLGRLKAAGFELPMAMSQTTSRASIHNLATWVWSRGSDFITPDGKSLLLTEPKTRAAMQAYFSISRHCPPMAQKLSDEQCYNLFFDGKAVITLRNSSLMHSAIQTERFQEHLPNTGLAPMPGVNFIGGSNLVIWKHISPSQERAAIQFLTYLASEDTQYAHHLMTGSLPAQLNALDRMGMETVYAPVTHAIKNGRSFLKFRLWGLVEDKLSTALGRIWDMIYAEENPDLEKLITNEMDFLQKRLSLTISSS